MTSQMSEMNGTLKAVAALAPVIAARSEETERVRRVPPGLVEELTAAGCFRMLVPDSHGGAELDFPSEMRVIAGVKPTVQLADADAQLRAARRPLERWAGVPSHEGFPVLTEGGRTGWQTRACG